MKVWLRNDQQILIIMGISHSGLNLFMISSFINYLAYYGLIAQHLKGFWDLKDWKPWAIKILKIGKKSGHYSEWNPDFLCF